MQFKTKQLLVFAIAIVMWGELRRICLEFGSDPGWSEFYKRTGVGPKPSVWPYDASAFESAILVTALATLIFLPLNLTFFAEDPQVNNDARMISWFLWFVSLTLLLAWIRKPLPVGFFGVV